MARSTKLLICAAGLGLLFSAAVHVGTFFGVDLQRKVPGIMLLHLLVFVVGIPAIFISRKVCGKDDPWRFFDVFLRRAPTWMQALVFVLLIHAPVNFLYVALGLNQGGMPSTDGPKALVGHGRIIRRLTDEEYEKHQAYFVRGHSGQWMFFYAAAMTMLYALGKEAASQNVDPTEQDESST